MSLGSNLVKEIRKECSYIYVWSVIFNSAFRLRRVFT